jgi:hypothetical protein
MVEHLSHFLFPRICYGWNDWNPTVREVIFSFVAPRTVVCRAQSDFPNSVSLPQPRAAEIRVKREMNFENGCVPMLI